MRTYRKLSNCIINYTWQMFKDSSLLLSKLQGSIYQYATENMF